MAAEGNDHPCAGPMSSRTSGGETRAQAPFLFVYGSLMNEQVLAALLGREPECRPAELRGYSRRVVRGHSYPAIVPSPHSVSGVLLQSLTSHELDIFDWFEDDEYSRREVCVEVEGGRVPAQTFVWTASADLLGEYWTTELHFLPSLEQYIADTVLCREAFLAERFSARPSPEERTYFRL